MHKINIEYLMARLNESKSCSKEVQVILLAAISALQLQIQELQEQLEEA